MLQSWFEVRRGDHVNVNIGPVSGVRKVLVIRHSPVPEDRRDILLVRLDGTAGEDIRVEETSVVEVVPAPPTPA